MQDLQGKGSGPCETVAVVSEITEGNPNGYVLINKSDFDPELHKEFKGELKSAPSTEDEDTDTEEVDVGSMTVDQLKEKLDELGIEYPSKANKADLQALLTEALK